MGKLVFRPGEPADVEGIIRVRTSVRENAMTLDELAALDITPRTFTAGLRLGELASFTALEHGRVVGFSSARRKERDVFALFVQPEHEGRGAGTRLPALAEEWLNDWGSE